MYNNTRAHTRQLYTIGTLRLGRVCVQRAHKSIIFQSARGPTIVPRLVQTFRTNRFGPVFGTAAYTRVLYRDSRDVKRVNK